MPESRASVGCITRNPPDSQATQVQGTRLASNERPSVIRYPAIHPHAESKESGPPRALWVQPVERLVEQIVTRKSRFLAANRKLGPRSLFLATNDWRFVRAESSATAPNPNSLSREPFMPVHCLSKDRGLTGLTGGGPNKS